MNDSSSALPRPGFASLIQAFSTSQFATDRGTDEVLHADVVLAGPNPEPFDQRAGQFRGQWVDRFVSFDARAWHTTRIRRSAEPRIIRTSHGLPWCIGLLVCRLAMTRPEIGVTVENSEAAMLHTAPIESAGSGLEQRGPGPRTIGASLAVAALLTAAYAGQAQVLMMPAFGMIAVIAAVIDARTLRIPNWLTGVGALVIAGLSVYLVIVDDHAWRPIVAGAAIMGGPLLGAHLVSKSRTPGLGDIKLAAVLGAPLGAVSPAAAYWALLVALTIGAVFGLLYQRTTKRRVFPLGPAISLASVLTAFAFGLTGSNETWAL
jgi:Flp pilus assembly protein protease CpaA